MSKRFVQFVIERECPEPGDVPTNLEDYPAAVFVEWPPVSGQKLLTRCSSARFYRLARAESLLLGYYQTCDWYVCEHMGSIIE